MTLFLLDKQNLKKSEIMTINDQIIYEKYDLIIKIFSQYCPDIQLAEPVVTENQNKDTLLISWYVDTFEEPKIITGPQKQQIYQKMAISFKNLFENISRDSSSGKIVEAVLHITDFRDILISGDKIIIKNWGANSFQDNKKSGIYLPSLFQFSSEPKPAKDAISHFSDEKKVNGQIKSSIKSRENSTVNPKISSRFRFLTNFNNQFVLSRLIAAILFFFIGLLLGWRIIFAEHPIKINGITVREAHNLVKQYPQIEKSNHDLETEIKILKDRLKNPPCNIRESRADPSLNKSLEHPFTPMTSTGKIFEGSLPELLEKSTVFIMVLKDDDVSAASGTGFFVTSDTIVTNRHVVENAKNNSVMVTNKSLGQLKLAHVVSVSQTTENGGLDLAILKVENAPPQQPLSFSLDARPLQDVVAAGYPGIMISQDDAMQRLMKGDLQAIPGVILTKGQINGIQNNHNGEKIMPHSAMVSPGNSGGPLVDLCGRVVGVNTFVTMDQYTSSHGNYAQKSDMIVRVLQSSNLPIQVQSGACQPEPVEKQDQSTDKPASKSDKSEQDNNQSSSDPIESKKDNSK